MENDASMPGTPVDASNSTFTNGPAGQQAYPVGTPPDDRVASTEWGRPRSRRSSRSRRRWSSPSTTSPAGSGCSSAVTDRPVRRDRRRGDRWPRFYSHLDPSPVAIAQGETVDLMAAYRVVKISPPGDPELIPIDYITFIEWLLDYDRLVDPRPTRWDIEATGSASAR